MSQIGESPSGLVLIRLTISILLPLADVVVKAIAQISIKRRLIGYFDIRIL
ncbi:MAG: hypothetical protein IM537_14585 [Pseudanabaena sp. M57BS1SP1A06MG]|nr:hypothetical protein [Pseudanabaena sp. M34BS1SP1A06MG]MCA6594673.1 hypothetical protein [Pseudanabaena sp. M38BS1SP1A06MG]MCA6601390.1 hypothetical protein [Pseudanabaena sp. M57BS1SP1A06MG]